MNSTEYITVTTWDEECQCMRYHYVHESVDDPKQYVLSLYPQEVIMVRE